MRCDVVTDCFRKAGFTSGSGVANNGSKSCVNNDIKEDFTLPEIGQYWKALRAEGSMSDNVQFGDFLFTHSCMACTEELHKGDIVANL